MTRNHPCPSGTSRIAPAAATLTLEPITAFPPPIAARIGFPSIGNTGTAVLHFARNPDDRAFAIRDYRSVEQFHQVWHQTLSEHLSGLEQRSQIFDELTGERVADDRHPNRPSGRSACLDAEFREYRFTDGDNLADLDHDLVPLRLAV